MSEFKCIICLTSYHDETTMFLLQSCEHIYHKRCLTLLIQGEIAVGKCPVKCPVMSCSKEFIDPDLSRLINKEDKDKYLQFAFNSAMDQQADVSWCPSLSCQYAFFYEEGITDFKCPKCAKRFCLACRAPFHKGQSCKEYQIAHSRDQNDAAFMAFARGAKLKQCPGCGQMVEKAAGCDHMKCRCGRDFCYRCGGMYMQCECFKRKQKQKEELNQRMANLRKENAEKKRDSFVAESVYKEHQPYLKGQPRK
ncbi:hypothetical protein FGO68_gene2846 [Halteria grandinella]|uniref:RBR-type E3 ubiquitin transferase n=1 Tax=Halteria grandinella TaxID=5974 RepID=A0A8J8T612_HALGN|nr:hypothetical protein FGO68_gene2846 [Halteria grandinella]